MAHIDKAREYFSDGYNCAQATALAFAAELGLGESVIAQMTAGFGGGMGGLREQCGAVSAMVFVAGMAKGDYDPRDLAAKKALYDNVKELITAFTDRFGTTSCRELLAKASVFASQDPSERTDEYFKKRPCVRFVEAAAG
ncbi:MAG: C-GCAxxG-C-C family protein, partial [Spirochaetota bacterium]